MGGSHEESQRLCDGSSSLVGQEVGVPAEAGMSCQDMQEGSLHTAETDGL